MKNIEIVVDFDGTVVEHKYPEVGHDVPGAVDVLKKLVAQGHQIILWTMRSNESLQDAVNWYKGHNIPLCGINQHPTQKDWTNSPKPYGHHYIDDAAVGCPLTFKTTTGPDGKIIQVGRPYVNWTLIEQALVDKGVLENENSTPQTA